MENLQKCTICSKTKSIEFFTKDKTKPKGIKKHCKECDKDKAEKRRHSENGLISNIYGNQIKSSKRRGHNPPSYAMVELREWVFSNTIFIQLFKDWKESGFKRELAPSVDRLDDNKGYSFDNIQLMSWDKNKEKSHKDMKNGKLMHKNKPQKPVKQLSLDGIFIKKFHSIMEASRQTKISDANISRCCNNKARIAGGYIWEYAV